MSVVERPLIRPVTCEHLFVLQGRISTPNDTTTRPPDRCSKSPSEMSIAGIDDFSSYELTWPTRMLFISRCRV